MIRVTEINDRCKRMRVKGKAISRYPEIKCNTETAMIKILAARFMKYTVSICFTGSPARTGMNVAYMVAVVTNHKGIQLPVTTTITAINGVIRNACVAITIPTHLKRFSPECWPAIYTFIR